MSFDTGDNPALDGDLLKDTVDMLESEGYRRGEYFRDRWGFYGWVIHDRTDPYLTFRLAARASPIWHKPGYGPILSVHQTLLLDRLRRGYGVIVIAVRPKPGEPTEFYVFDADEIRSRQYGTNWKGPGLMVNFPARIGHRWFPGHQSLRSILKQIGDRQRKERELRQRSLFQYASGGVVA